MFCKNLIVYEIKQESALNEITPELIDKVAFIPCSPTDSASGGFISPLDNEKLMIEINNQILLKYQTEQKILPNSVVKKALQAKIEKQEIALDRRLTKSEKLVLEDEVYIDLLPKAFSKYEQFNVWIDKANKTISITTASFMKAEKILASLRKELGQLSVTLLSSDGSPEKYLTQWLQGNKPNDFELGDCAVLFDAVETHSKIKLINEQVQDSQEVKSYLNAGREVESIAIYSKSGVSFTINKNLVLSKIKFDSSILDKNEDFHLEERERKIEADFIMVSSILSEIIKIVKKMNSTKAHKSLFHSRGFKCKF
ncbi:recombination-associated protein RdgC [Orbaceae bacterium ac157xtp]